MAQAEPWPMALKEDRKRINATTPATLASPYQSRHFGGTRKSSSPMVPARP